MTKLSKSDLRLRLSAERQALSQTQAATRSQKIVERCIELIPWNKTHHLHMYMPIESRQEVNTWGLLAHALKQTAGLQVTVPVMDGQTMRSVVVGPTTDWHNNAIGIPEPVAGTPLADDQKFDVIVVPMLGFDESGYRLGNGGGHYDRFLQTQPQALTIGLSYDLGQLGSELAQEPHDVSLQYIVTERSVLEFKSTNPQGSVHT